MRSSDAAKQLRCCFIVWSSTALRGQSGMSRRSGNGPGFMISMNPSVYTPALFGTGKRKQRYTVRYTPVVHATDNSRPRHRQK